MRAPGDREVADVIHTAHIRVRDLSCGSHLIVKLHEALRVGGKRLGQQLDGDLLTEPEVVCTVDLAHAPLAEQADDPVPRVDDRTRREAPMIDRPRRTQPPLA